MGRSINFAGVSVLLTYHCQVMLSHPILHTMNTGSVKGHPKNKIWLGT